MTIPIKATVQYISNGSCLFFNISYEKILTKFSMEACNLGQRDLLSTYTEADRDETSAR